MLFNSRNLKKPGLSANRPLNNSAQFSEQDANFARFRTHESDANFPRGVPGSREIADKCRIRVDVESECESESGMKKLRIEKYPHTGPKGVSSF